MTILLFIFGSIWGSFINAWEYRIEKGLSLKGRSICPRCKKQIAWFDNIPLLSWILLRGRCRHCHKPISIQYPTVELLTGLVFVLLWLYSNPGVALSQWLNEIYNLQFTTYNPFPIIDLLKFILLIAYFVLLILIALHDAKTKYVLSKYVYIACALAAAYTGLKFSAPFSSANILQYYSPYFLSAIIPAGVFLTINKLSGGRAMGEGDAEVALTIGLILGWPIILPAYFFAFVFGAIYGITILLRKKGGLKSELPLGPFLVTGTIFAFFYGAPLINWYIGIFLGL